MFYKNLQRVIPQVIILLFGCILSCESPPPAYSIEQDSEYSGEPKTDYIKYGSRVLWDADVASFEVLKHEHYAKDKSTAYHNGNAVENSDPNSFISISNNHAKDQYNIYHNDQAILEVDHKTFEVISDLYSKDVQHVYVSNRVIQGADVNTFEPVSNEYSRDHRDYFYDSIAFQASHYESFEILGMGYAKNESKVYFSWCKIEDIIVNHNKVGVSKNYQIKELLGADPESFRVIEIESKNPLNRFAKDTSYVYWQDQVIESANPETFEHVNGHLTRDDRSYFFLGSKMEVDYNTFEIVYNSEGSYNFSSAAKDKNNVYLGNEITPNYDPENFGSYTSEDKWTTFGFIWILALNLLVAWRVKTKGYLFKILMTAGSLLVYGFIFFMFMMGAGFNPLLIIIALAAGSGVPILTYIITNNSRLKVLNPPKDADDFVNNPRFSYSRVKPTLLIIGISLFIFVALYNWIVGLF